MSNDDDDDSTTTTAHNNKRERSPSLEPMVAGVHHQGFLLESKWILKKFKHNNKKLNDKPNYMLESAAEHLGENIVGAQELGLKGIAQLVSTLFEVAVWL